MDDKLAAHLEGAASRIDMRLPVTVLSGFLGARFAVYLVHSMMPSARLTQASFADVDLLCADNFARAAKRAGPVPPR